MRLLRSHHAKGLFSGALAAAALLSAPTQALAWADPGQPYRTRIELNPTAAGAAGELGRGPVLVRLYSGDFSFKDAKADGSDIRFYAGDDRTPLKFHLEKFSPQDDVALAWVDVPGLGTAQGAAIYAYYGAKAAPAGGQDAAGTYDADTQLVWHFTGEGAPQDASGRSGAGAGPVARDPGGLIGPAARFDGRTTLGLPAALQLAAGQPLSVELWVKAPAGANGTLLGFPGALTLGLQNGVPYLDVGGKRTAPSAPALTADAWTHLAVRVGSGRASLYVGGQEAGQVEAPLPASAGAGVLGQGFTGEIDELRISKAELPAGAIALAAHSEGDGARLLSFDKAEQTRSVGPDYLGILFKALTPDAWAVIAILGVMALISWGVMIAKGLFIGRTGGANDDFIYEYEQRVSKVRAHEGLVRFDPGKLAAGSSLARLFRIGQRELKVRLDEAPAAPTNPPFALAPQSVAAIRSALDAGQAREAQKLNQWMVLLTIAISGGPFLGLLGTVVGVMITFAGVAAAGDVNINAIAPGIAAALLATVAGLGVAIPALFGYNYLQSRISEIETADQIFVDELEKRIAEVYRGVPLPPLPIAAE
jgi:biopolymer transport protein ExbB